MQDEMKQKLKKKLSTLAYQVCVEKKTEPPFYDQELHVEKKGHIYQCVCCKNPLFYAKDKFNSGTGWPSFTKPVEKNSVHFHVDNSLAMTRIEVTCGNCGAHLGHVFDDGPEPEGMRYCINSVALSAKDATS